MKNKLIWLFVFMILPVMIFSQAKKMGGSEYCSYKKSNRRTTPDLYPRSPGSPVHSFDVLHYKLDLDLFSCYSGLFPKSFSGSNTITFRVDSALNFINLNASDSSLQIDSLGLSGKTFLHSAGILTIHLNKTYNPGDTVTVIIYYQHKDVTDHAFFANSGFVFTDCEPEGARCWFPCWDKPSDKATFELSARVPKNVLMGSNGSLTDSTLSGDTLSYHWKSKDPLATYLATIASNTGYKLKIVYCQKLSNPNDSIPMRFYYNSNENPSEITDIICPMTTYYSQLFCEHPFEKNGFATLNDDFIWGGMENQTLTSLCADCWNDDLIAHEFAHQWFGDMITCATWSDIFLNEGFATFITALWMGNIGGYKAYKTELLEKADWYLGHNPGWAICQPSWSVVTPDNPTLFNYAITYCKGACVLHMLRYIMDDSAFFKSVKAYASDTVNFAYKSATIPDFIDKMETVSGQELSWFFDRWIYQPNHPVYQNVYYISDMGSGTWQVDFTTAQIQANPSFFQMPVELKVFFHDGSDTLLKVMNDVNNQNFSFQFFKQPDSLQFDPFTNIILKEATLILDFKENSASGKEFLFQNEPNPFGSFTAIKYNIPQYTHVKITIYDVYGKILATPVNEYTPQGGHQIVYNGSGLPPGIYFYRMETERYTETKRMIMAK